MVDKRQYLSGFESGIAGVDEDHDLVTFFDHVDDFVVTDEIHHLHLTHGVDLFDADEALRERDGPEARIKVVESFVGIHAQEVGHVDVVGQRGRKTQNSNHTLRRFHLFSFINSSKSIDFH